MIDIVEKLDQQTVKRIKQFPHPNNRASEAGHPCLRFLVLSRLHLEKKVLHDVGLQRIFDEGRLHEGAILREVEDAGFKIVEQQRPFEWQKFRLTGHIDAKISMNGQLIPLEVKSSSPNAFRHIKDLEPMEMVSSRLSWVRKYPAQILLYMLMDNKEEGIILFKNKTTGEKCQKNFKLDYEYVESILTKLEMVNEYVEKKEIPKVEMCEDCKGCGFQKTSCFSDCDYGPGFAFLSDKEKSEKLDRRDILRPAYLEYGPLHKLLAGHFRGQNVVISGERGDYKIETKVTDKKTTVSIEKL